MKRVHRSYPLGPYSQGQSALTPLLISLSPHFNLHLSTLGTETLMI